MRIHLIPNSHIDPVWLWDKYEGIDEVLNTFRSACDRLDEYPDLTFSASSIQFYEWTLKYDERLFGRIQRAVAEGRWEITGGWWIEADTNLPSAASLFKQAALSLAFVRKHFAKNVDVAYLPDTFGHPASLPKILSESGFKFFIFCRPNDTENQELPGNLFYWEYEGGRVLAYRLKHHYLQYAIRPPGTIDPQKILPLLQDKEYHDSPVNCYFFGVGNHGGGPAIAEIEFYNRFIQQQAADDVGYSSCGRFFEEASHIPDIPVYSGDLHRHAIGCYSVARDIKHAMRRSEQHLGFADRALRMTGRSEAQLDSLWKKTLFNQFHDILPGSCSKEAAEQAKHELGSVQDACQNIAYSELKTISRTVQVSIREGEFRIFNTLPFPVTLPLSLEAFVSPDNVSGLLDAEGCQIPIQEVLPGVRCINRRWEFVDTLPAAGCKSYSFDANTDTTPLEHEQIHFQKGEGIATELAEIKTDGTVAIRKTSHMHQVRLMSATRFLLLDDPSDAWGHDVSSFDAVEDVFVRESSATAVGAVTSKLYERYRCRNSTIDVVYSLYEHLPSVFIDITVLWNENRKILKMELPIPERSSKSLVMQGPGGAIRRTSNGQELPLHHWLCLETRFGNIAVMQEGAFACDDTPERLRVTLVRSNLYGYDHHTPLDANDPQQRTDQGEHHFRFRIFSTQDVDIPHLEQEALAFTEPYLMIREGKS